MNRENVLDILKKYKKNNFEKYSIENIGLFGSFARDENNINSDVDVVIQTTKSDMFEIVHIKDELEKLLRSSVDIVRFRETMNPFLKNRISKEAIYV